MNKSSWSPPGSGGTGQGAVGQGREGRGEEAAGEQVGLEQGQGEDAIPGVRRIGVNYAL